MKFLDMLIMSVNNLRRRKLRTALTVLGVIIGTASIVVMVSLGIGFNQTIIDQISESGSLTTIQIYNYNWGSNGEDNFMTDSTMKMFENLPYVETVSPMLYTSVIMKQGKYESYIGLLGVSREYLEQIPLKEGSMPKSGSKELELIVGNNIIQQFYNPKVNESYWETGKLPEVDFMNRPMFVIFDMDAYYNAMYGDGQMPKKYLINTAGLAVGEVDEWNEYSYRVYVEIDNLKTMLKQIFKKKPIPGQPTNAKGKPYSEFIYDEAVVYVDDMNHVTEVQKLITDMGYQASSNMEYLETMQKQSQMAQAVLGGIGAVSLFVAAIGIANTMMMSIYERTKEIGIIKVLGCAMKNIRTMFLMEAGFIGFLGGILGLLLSIGISGIINQVLSSSMLFGYEGGKLSVIPSWLAILALGFAIAVGMIAGFFPALRAMKLSPLAAIKTE